jgi:hypothetical protein
MKIGDIISWDWNITKSRGKVIEYVNEEYNDFRIEMIFPFPGTTITWHGDDNTSYKVEGHEDEN